MHLWRITYVLGWDVKLLCGYTLYIMLSFPHLAFKLDDIHCYCKVFSFIAKPNGKGKVTFRCSSLRSLVEVVKVLQDGKEIKINLQKYRDSVKRACYSQSAEAISKGFMVISFNQYIIFR